MFEKSVLFGRRFFVDFVKHRRKVEFLWCFMYNNRVSTDFQGETLSVGKG